MSTLMRSWGCEVTSATDGHEAESVLRDTDALPDIIIADQQLDHGDLGTNVVENIKYYTGRKIPAIIVTADPSDYVQRKTQQAGLDLMPKPVKPAQLRALMMHLLKPNPAATEPGK
jgi:CheY-like chemotaxis protein